MVADLWLFVCRFFVVGFTFPELKYGDFPLFLRRNFTFSEIGFVHSLYTQDLGMLGSCLRISSTTTSVAVFPPCSPFVPRLLTRVFTDNCCSLQESLLSRTTVGLVNDNDDDVEKLSKLRLSLIVVGHFAQACAIPYCCYGGIYLQLERRMNEKTNRCGTDSRMNGDW